MSATGRKGGTPRQENDDYQTPDWACRIIFPHLPASTWDNAKGGRILEPMCGIGNMMVALVSEGVDPARIIGVELDPGRAEMAAARCPGARVFVGDVFPLLPKVLAGVDLVMTNPAFSVAFELLQSLDVDNRARGRTGWETFLLLRYGFIEGKERAEYVGSQNPDVFGFSHRPRFVVGSGGDSCPYSWMGFAKGARRDRTGRHVCLPYVEIPRAPRAKKPDDEQAAPRASRKPRAAKPAA